MDIKEFLLARIAEDEAAAGAKPVVDLPVTRVHHPHSIEEVPGYVLPMTIETFAHDRLEAGTMEASFTPNPARVLRECAAKRAIVKQHEAWPVLIEQPLEFTNRVDDGNNVIFQASRKMAWLTEREYVARFGEAPPTAPMIRTLAAIYSDHPDYQPEWAA